MDRTQLKTEFTVDPAGLGYATATTQGKVDLINQTRPTIAITRRVATSEILRYLAMVPFRLAEMPPDVQTAWKLELDIIRGIPDFDVSDQYFQQLLTQGVTQGILTSDEKAIITALGSRPGSRSEQLWGAGKVVTLNDAAGAQ